MNIPVNDSHPANSTTLGSGPILWYQFDVCKSEPYGFVFYFFVKVLNMVVGIPANVMVMWHVTKKRADPSTSDIFIFNMALLDAFFSLVTPIELVNRLLLGDDRIWYFQRLAYGIKDVTPLFLTCVCLDRYVAVVHPIVFSRVKDNRIRIALSSFVWTLILAYALSKSIVNDNTINEVFAGLILSAFSIMVFCNISIIWVLRRSVIGKEEMHPTKKRAFRMVMIALAIIVALYLPPVALFPFSRFYSFVAFNCKISVVVFAIMDLSCSIEPLLYISKMTFLDIRGCTCCQSLSKNPIHVTS
ncbi:hydroxycarboxylic acid receptor 2 [Paramormyrops kingsleyae]|uniref:hydroxycarboxylic acid receptor 2 n=1 Tax=Paramormyrops kingsleyae TaxID=1676925 RepID=UPI003B97228D